MEHTLEDKVINIVLKKLYKSISISILYIDFQYDLRDKDNFRDQKINITETELIKILRIAESKELISIRISIDTGMVVTIRKEGLRIMRNNKNYLTFLADKEK